jgi:hypothetical protein
MSCFNTLCIEYIDVAFNAVEYVLTLCGAMCFLLLCCVWMLWLFCGVGSVLCRVDGVCVLLSRI